MKLISVLPRAYSMIQRAYASLPKALGNGRAFPPLRHAFVITHRCNLKCAWCMVTHPETRKTWKADQELSPQEIEDIVRQTLRFCMITITGGEPFVRKDIVEILDRVGRLRPTHLVSNATLITDEELEWLVGHSAGSLWGKGLATIGISLEGFAELHDSVVGIPGSYDKTIAFIEKLIEQRRAEGKSLPLIDAKIVLSRDNWEQLPGFRRRLATMGVDMVTVQIQNNQTSAYGIPTDDKTAHLRFPPPVERIPTRELSRVIGILTEEGKSSPGRIRFTPPLPLSSLVAHYAGNLTPACLDCHATWTTSHVGPYGDLFPCFSYSMGNTREQTLSAIWNGSKYRDFRKGLKKSIAFPGCIGCCMASARSNRVCAPVDS